MSLFKARGILWMIFLLGLLGVILNLSGARSC